MATKKKAAPQRAYSIQDLINEGIAYTPESTDPTAAAEPKNRTWGQAIGDTAVQLAEGVNTTLGAIPSIVAPDGSMAGFFRDNAGYWRDKQSDVLKQRIAATDQRIQEAGKEGVMSQIGTAVSEYWNDPAQAARLVATNLPSMAATLLTGGAAGAMAKGAAAARGLDAAQKAALAAQYGTRTAMATNAALNAGGARGEAYEDLKRAALAQGMSPEQAEQAALDGSVMPGVVGGVAGAVSGKLGLEKALLGQPGVGAGTALRRAAGSFGAELAGEQIEEVAPKLTTNYEAGKIDPARSLTDDIGRTIVETTIGAGPGAVVAGGVEGMSSPAQAAADQIRSTEKVPESGTLTKAVNAGVEAKAQAVEAGAPLVDEQATAEPVDDPVRDQILALPDGARQDALRAYAVLNRPDAAKGVLQLNRKLLDRLLAENAPPPVLGERLTDTDMGSMLGGGGMAGNADPIAGMLGGQRDSTANAIDNVYRAAEGRPPMPASDAARMLDEARNRGLDLTVAEHPAGGFVIVPPAWVTPDMAAQGEARLAETIARMQQADAAPVERTPRTRTDGVGLSLQTDPVQNYLDNLRSVNTPAARAYVRDFDAGRISPADVQQRMQAERGLTPEQRIARAAAEAPATADPVADRLQRAAAQGVMDMPAPTDILNPAGQPFKTRMAADRAAKKTPGAVVPVEGGFVVRPKESVSVQDVPQAPEVSQAAPVVSPPGQAPQAVGAQPAGPAAGVPAEGVGAVEAAGVEDSPPAAPTIVEVQDNYGRTHRVRQSDLYGSADRIPTVRKNGEVVAGEEIPRSIVKDAPSVAEQPPIDPPTTLVQPDENQPAAQAAPAAGAQAQAQGGEVEALRQKLRDVEDKIIAAAPSAMGQGGGDIEAAMKSRKVPVTLKAQRKMLKEQLQQAKAQQAQAATESVAQDAGQSPAQETTHNGTRIYPTKIKVGDEVKSMWAVESPDNQRRRAAGERTIGGDSLHDTLEQAKAAAEREAKRDAEQQAAKAEQDAADKARLDAEEARKAANRPKTVVERRKDAILDGPSKIGQGSKRAVITTAVDNGYAIEAKMVYDHAAKKRDQEAVDRASRAGYILGVSNENLPLVKAGNEAKARLKEGKYEKPEYRVYQGSDTKAPFREITKTEYDYAQELKAQRAAAPRAEAAQPTTPQQDGNEFLPEGWTKSVNGFTKRPVYRMEQGVGQPFAVVTQTDGMTYEVQIRHGDKQLTAGTQRGALSEVLAAAEAELGRMKQADSVTHADPGQAPEAATPAVVTDSLKKAARNEDTKPSEMRKWLVAEIDKELLQAPDRADYDEAVKRLGEKDAISGYTGNGPLGKNNETGYITFDVPGDGKYKVRNSVRGLLEFRKNVMASQGFKDSGQKRVKPEQNDGVQGGSGGNMAAITNMIEEGDFEAARDYAEAVGIARLFVSKTPKNRDVLYAEQDGKLREVTYLTAEQKAQWDRFMSDGTLPTPPDTRPQPAPKTAAQLDEEKRQAAEAEAKKPKDTGWNMAGTGYGGKRYIGRNITLDDGREVVARVYENAGTYEEAEVKVDGVRKFTFTDRDNAQGKADAFVKTLIEAPAAEAAKSPARVTPQISGNPEKFIKVAADSVRELRSVDVDRVLTETPVQFRAEVASYIRERRKDLADEVADVMADIQPKAAAPAPAPSIPAGPRRDPAKVSMFAPYEDGDIVAINGQDWTVKQDTPGWYLTTTGNWRGQHPTIRNIKAMADLIREVEQASVAQKAAEIEPEAPKLTPAEAKSLMALEDLGQKDGVKTHALTFYESQADKDAKRGRMIVAKVSRGDRSATAWMVDGEDKTFGALAQAKKLAEEVGMAKAVADGFVQEVNPFAEYDAIAKQYGYEVRPDGMIGRNGKFPGPKVSLQKGRLRVESSSGNLLGSYAQTPSSIGKFLEAFWFAEKLDQTAPKPAATANPAAANDRNAFTLQRLNRDTGQMEPVTFERGEYVRYTVGGKDKFGDIDGISQARKEFSVDGLWYPFGFAYKAERPAAPKADTVPLSSVIDKVNAKNGQGLTDADRVPSATDIGWDAMSHEQRTQILTAPSGWSTAKGGLNVIGKNIAKRAWADIAPATRATIERLAQKLETTDAEPASKTPTVDRHNATMAAVREGKATPEQFQSSFEQVVSNKAAIMAELDTMTKVQLLREGGPFVQMRYANEKKADVVDAMYREMVGEYALGESVTYSMGKGAFEAAVRKMVEATDADKLASYVTERQAAMEERKAARAAKAAAIENPQTLADFREAINARMRDGMARKEAFLALTPDQRIQYDTLEAESTREARETRKRAQKTQVRAAGQTTAGEIVATKHTRDGYDLFVVKLADRLSADDYKTVLASAKKLGGWYSAFRGNGAIPGFQFKDKANAEAFLALAGGDTTAAQEQVAQRRDAFEDDRSQTAVERLRAMADKLEEGAAEVEGQQRKTNTERRARFASAALQAAAADKAKAQTMRNIAQAIEAGDAKFLDAVRTKSQVDMLTGIVDTAKGAELRAKYPSYADQEKRKGEPPTAETADFADFPSYSSFRSDLATLGRQMLEVDGTKKLGQRLMSVADDVTDSYLEFAKANFQDVSRFGRGDSLADFASKEEAERAIKRSGLTGKAIVLPIKRGQNRVILSPSEAIGRGLWQGDGDKRITLTAEFGAELVEAIGRRGNKQNKLSVPWQFQNAYDRRKALSRIGIETPSEFRAALREFISLKEQAIANRTRELELQMVGRKADGLDFFPTSAEVADQMIEAADLSPDMAVLEPSAGMGHLADRIRQAGAEPDVIEISADRRELLEEKGYTTQSVDDFLDLKPREFYTFGDTFRAPDGAEGIMRGANGNRVRLVNQAGDMVGAGYYDRADLTGVAHNGTASGYDRIIMNPPFSNRRDAEHVRHAYSLLKPGGRIVAIMGEGVFFGQDKKAQDFREWLESVGGTSEKLPEGSFMDPSLPVNTSVNARMVVIDKPASAPVFSRDSGSVPQSPAEWLTDTVIADEVEKRISSFAQQPPIRIRDTAFGQLPGVARNDNVAGAVHDGAIYLFRDQLGDRAAVQRTLFHELFHYGLRKFLTKAQFTEQMMRLYSRDKSIKDEADRWASTADGLRAERFGGREYALARGVDEALAILAEPNGGAYLNKTPRAIFIRRLTGWLADVAEFLKMDKAAAYLRSIKNEEAREYIQSIFKRLETDEGGNATDWSEASEPAFSRTTETAKAVGDAIKSVTVTNIKQRAGFKLTDYLGIGLQALGRRQIVDIYGDLLPLVEYNRLVQQMEADKNEGGAEADQLVTRWAKLDDEGKLADLMHDATLAQIDPAEDFVEGDDKGKYLELQRKYILLSDEAKKVYADTRDSYKAHHAKVRSAIKERIERSEIKGERKAALLKQMDDEFFKAINGVYFPLARFGQYAVTVKGPDGKVESVSRAETKAEAEALRSNLLSAFPRDKGFTVGRVMLSKDFIADRDAVGRGFMTELYQVLDQQNMDAAQRAELEDTLGQLYLSSLPDLSWAKHGIHRKGTPGFSQDARRAFAQNMFHGARYLAKLRYSDLMQDELTAMQRHVDDWREVEDFDQNSAQRVVDEMNKRHESLMNPQSNALSTALTSLGFVFHLGLSPASAMVNLSQTALVAYPIMGAKWGYGKAGAALMKASAEAAKGKNDITASLNEDERAAYDEAVRAGTIDVTMAHDLAGIAQGEDAGVMWKIRPVMRYASFLFHHAERFNRQVTFVAAYRLAREAGADAKSAYEQATKATYDGHYDYSAANRPRIMQGNVAKVLLLFKQYGQNMVYTLARNAQQAIKGESPEVRAQARKALGGLLATHAMAAGVLGLPMVTTLLAAASMIGGDDDEPWDAKVALQNMLADAFGQKPAEVLAHGLSRLTPWDISGRVGLDKLIFPDVQEGLEGQRLAESAMAAALGPVAGIGINVLKGLQDMSQGQYERGLESMMPAALRGPIKAIRYESEGVQDKTGVVIKDEVSLAGVAGQFLGFSPSEVRNATEGKSAVIQQDRALGERRQELLTKAARATMAKDAEARAEAMKEIERFNQKNPTRRITPLNVLQSVRNRQKRIDQAEGGVYLPKNRRDAMEAGRFAVAE